jgi:aspartate aminotransferase
VYSAPQWRSLADVLVRHPHVSIICDDIYEHLVYGSQRFTTLLEIAPELADRTVVVNGLSKSFSMTGWRIGYGVGPRSVIQAMKRLQSHTTSGANCIAQWAAVAALNDERSVDFLTERRAIFQERRSILVDGLADIMPVALPDGAFYAYADVMPLMAQKGAVTDLDLGQKLLEQAWVCGVPGSEFGFPGYLRFSYALSCDVLKRAVERIARWAQQTP